MAKECLLGGKRAGETSFLSKHMMDGAFELGFQDGKMMRDGLDKYSVKPKPLIGSIEKGLPIMGRKNMAHA